MSCLFALAYRLHSYHPRGKNSTEVSDLASLLVLATTYRIPSIRARTLRVLSRRFPRSLAKWDKRSFNVNFERDVFQFAQSAKLAGAWTLLPAILLQCCMRQQALAAIGFDAPSCNSQSCSNVDGFAPDSEDAKLVDRARAYLSTDALRQVCPAFYSTDAEDAPELCYTPCHCVRSKAKLVKWTEGSVFGWCYKPATFDSWLNSWGFCQQCQKVYGGMYREGREKIWDSLPEQLGMGSWENLEAKEDEEQRVRERTDSMESRYSDCSDCTKVNVTVW